MKQNSASRKQEGQGRPWPCTLPRTAWVPASERPAVARAVPDLLDLLDQGRDADLLAAAHARRRTQAGPPPVEETALVALALAALGQHHEAQEVAGAALRQAPCRPLAAHTAAVVLHLAQGHPAGAPCGPGAIAAGAGAAPGGQPPHGSDPARALALAGAAVQAAPEDAACWTLLAHLRRSAGDAAGALFAAGQAVQRVQAAPAGPPSPGAAHLERALALAASGDRDAARAALDLALAPPAPPAEAALWQGWFLVQEGRWDAAQAALRRALALAPDLAAAEDLLIAALAPGAPGLQAALRHLVAWGRLGWGGRLWAAFAYYLAFRLLQLLWRLWPPLLGPARAVLLAALAYLAAALVAGPLLRRWLRGRRVRP